MASLLEGINNLAIVPDKDTAALLNNHRKRRNSDSESFPFDAPESCTLSETELDQILGLFQKFTKVDKNFCNVQNVERPKQIGPATSDAAPSKSTDSKVTPVVSPVKASVKSPASSSKLVASRPTSTNSTKTISNPTSNSKLISSASKSTVNSTKMAASKSTGVVSPTKSATNSTTKPKISSIKSAANVVQLAVSSTKSAARNSTKPIVNPNKNSTETAATNPTAPLLTRRKRSLPTKSGGGCNKLIESIQLSTSSVRSAYCDLSNTEELDPRFNEKKAAYETEVAQLREKLDNKDLQIEQKYKTKLEQLNQDFQKLEKNMRDTLEKLESVDNLYRRAQAKVVIASLKSGDIKEALEEFEKIESLNNTIILITIALQDEFRIPIENVINFARGMKELEAVVHGTIHIFYELEKKQGFIEKKVVSLLKETVEGIMKQLVEREQKGNLASNIDRATVGQLVLLFNKLDYLLVSPFKYN